MEEKQINLGEVRRSGSKVYSGQPRGKSARQRFRIDDFDADDSVVVNVAIPPDTYSIGPSFLLGLFEASIARLGKSRFYQKYRFEWNPILLDSLHETVERALKTSNVLCA